MNKRCLRSSRQTHKQIDSFRKVMVNCCVKTEELVANSVMKTFTKNVVFEKS